MFSILKNLKSPTAGDTEQFEIVNGKVYSASSKTDTLYVEVESRTISKKYFLLVSHVIFWASSVGVPTGRAILPSIPDNVSPETEYEILSVRCSEILILITHSDKHIGRYSYV